MVETDDIVLLQVRGYLHGQRVINNFYYYCSAVTTPEPEPDLAEAFLSEWMTTYGADYTLPLSEDYKDGVVRAQLLRPNGTPVPLRWAYYQDVLAEPDGQVAEASLPSSTAAVFRRRTPLAGREYRGRIYIPGIPVSYAEDSKLTEAGGTAIEGAFAGMLLGEIDTGNSTWQPCITDAPLFSRITAVTTLMLDDVLRVQRRREVGVGE